MKKISVIALVIIMLLCCGCTPKAPKVADAQYVLAFNPSIMLEDGTVISLRNSAASSMQADMAAKTTNTLYEKTPWQWVYRDDDLNWNNRLVRELSNWSDSYGEVQKSAPYSYKMTDNGKSSLAVYDASKMDVKGVGNTLSSSGIILSFTGEKEEGIFYKANEDCLVELSDRNGGGISVVDSIYGVKTAFFENEAAKSSIVCKVYINKRIYWQEIISKANPSVSFPEFTNIELKKGDLLRLRTEE